MGARDCIQKKGKAGKVTQDRAQAASDLYDEQLAELTRRNTPNAEGVAEQRTLESLRHQTLAKKRATIAQIKAQETIRGRIAGTRANAAGAAMSLLDFDPTNRFAGANVVQMTHTIENQAFARMEGLLKPFRTRFANLDRLPGAAREARKANMRQVVRELYGEASGSPEAKAYADAAAAGMEYLRKLWNASGGTIPKLERWGLPQTHNRRALAGIDEPGLAKLEGPARRARKAQIWSEFILPRLDRSRMVDFNTGQPLSEPRLRQLLQETYEEIVTGGLTDVKATGGIGRNIVGRRAQSRFLIFKNADAYLEYHERFGDDNPFEAILNHVRAMSRDIALLRVLGPNPDASMRFVERLVSAEAGETALEGAGPVAARQAGNLFGRAAQVRRMYELITGRLDQPGNSTFAAIDESNRNILTSAILGGAAFSAITDRAFTFATASMLGLPNGRILARFLRAMNPASTADQELALQIGFGAEDFIGAAIGQARYLGEIMNPSTSRTLADSVLRASGLVRMTVAGRQAFQTEFLGELTRLRGQSFRALPPAMRDGFGLYGITQADWDEFRKAPVWKDPKSGAKFLRPHDLVGEVSELNAGPVFDRRFEVADKFMNMITAERDFAVPTSNTRARALLMQGTQPGTVGGFVARNIAALKTFPVTLMFMHMNRALHGRMPGMTRAKFAAQLIIGATLLGALAEQMSQISKGKDPLPMDDPKFMLKAASRGGGLGIFGDFIFSDVNRFGGGISDTILGPGLAQELPKLAKLTIGNAQELAIEGETTNAGRELVDFIRLMTPGRSLWYASLAFDRLIFDEMQMQLDPNYADSFDAVEGNAMREYGQEFFAPPGMGLPERGPNLEAALGQ